MKRVYLATSYSYDSKYKLIRKIVHWYKYRKVTKCLSILAARYAGEFNIFSPITHSHPVSKWIPERLDTHTFWLNIDFNWIDTCDEMWIYCQKGWDTSYGVNEERKYCIEKGIPIKFIEDDRYYSM